ncbi:hypothetical protein [Candidatus Pelagibacter sp.]|uniref:hypothetical protein n=1 Tax=Candidatus Pelagibacter sp. TaxID=2024849 RepID=UPI003F84DA5C
MEKKKTLICRFCGQFGFTGKKTKDLMGETYYTNKNKRCKICKNIFINDYDFSYWKQKSLTSGNQLNKRLKQIYKLTSKKNYLLFFIQDIHELYIEQDYFKDYSDEYIKKKIKKSQELFKPKKVSQNTEGIFDKTANTVGKGFSLIPDSIFGVGLYVLIILFFIWILGDSGGECGVDYAPRFFGEC